MHLFEAGEHQCFVIKIETEFPSRITEVLQKCEEKRS